MLAYASAAFESTSSSVAGARTQQQQPPTTSFVVPTSDPAASGLDQSGLENCFNIYHQILDQEYAQDILDWLLSVECRTLAIPEYMQNQTQLTWKMRKTLIIWLIQVTMEFNLTQDSLYLAVNLLDRVSSKRAILSRQYQLLGLTCLWIAAKVHENHGKVPTIKKLMYICCQTYTFDNFVSMERFALIELGCYLSHVSCEEFVSLYSFLYKLDPLTTSLARYLVEQSLIHKRFVGVRPSLIARCAVNLASIVSRGVEILSVPPTDHESICQSHLRDCLRSQPGILVKKFGGSDYHYASRFLEKYQTPSLPFPVGHPTPPSTSSSYLSSHPPAQTAASAPYLMMMPMMPPPSNKNGGLLTPPKDEFSPTKDASLAGNPAIIGSNAGHAIHSSNNGINGGGSSAYFPSVTMRPTQPSSSLNPPMNPSYSRPLSVAPSALQPSSTSLSGQQQSSNPFGSFGFYNFVMGGDSSTTTTGRW